MMDHIERCPKVGVFVLERIKTVWAGSHDPLRADLVELFGVGLSRSLEREFIAHSPRRIACAAFMVAKNRKGYVSRIEDLDQGAANLLATAIVAPRTADPEEDLGVGKVIDRRDVEAFGPRGPFIRGQSPRVADAADRSQGGLLATTNFTFANQVAANSTIAPSWSIKTGHSVTQARQLVQAQRVSAVMI